MIKIIAIIYLCLTLLFWLAEPFLFGKERKPYNPSDWFWRIIINAPLIWLLYTIATQ